MNIRICVCVFLCVINVLNIYFKISRVNNN